MATSEKEPRIRVPLIANYELPKWREAGAFNEAYMLFQEEMVARHDVKRVRVGTGNPNPRDDHFNKKTGFNDYYCYVPVSFLMNALRGLKETFKPIVEINTNTDIADDPRIATTANLTKFERERERIKRVINKEVPSPSTVHLIQTEFCNLTCTRCCCAGRVFNEELSADQTLIGLLAYALLKTPEVELTGGGETTAAKNFAFAVVLAWAMGYTKIGVITNGTLLDTIPDEVLKLIDWMRVSIYVHETEKFPNIERIKKLVKNVSVGLMYGLGSDDHETENPNVIAGHEDPNRKTSPPDKRQTMETVIQTLNWVDNTAKVPCKFYPDMIRPINLIERDALAMQQIVDDRYMARHLYQMMCGDLSMDDLTQYSFVADVKNKVRKSNFCIMGDFKPVITPSGPWGKARVDVCPCFVYAEENQFAHRSRKYTLVDSVVNILDYYKKFRGPRIQTCSKCQFAEQNNHMEKLWKEKYGDNIEYTNK